MRRCQEPRRLVTRTRLGCNLDFEQALRAEGTAMPVRELKNAKSTTPRRPAQPSTPTIIPPTPSPVAGPSSAKSMVGNSPASSAQDLFNESGGDDIDSRQTNRRSLYRSPGTSSSPDLATLMRKAKAKEKASAPKKDKLSPSSPFDRPSTTTRSRSSTSSYTNPPDSAASPYGPKDSKGKSKAPSMSPEWVLASPQPRSSPEKKSGSKTLKPSMRAKTSAFLGKVLGQGTVRERSKTDATPPSTPASVFFTNPFANSPPVPPLPPNIQQTPRRPREEMSPNQLGSPDLSKPLPPIISVPSTAEIAEDDIDDKSLVFVEKSLRAPSPEPEIRLKRLPSPDPIKPNKSTDTMKTMKRRSMSVSEFELKNAMSASSSVTPLPTPSRPTKKEEPAQSWDDSLHGILDDFKGQLSQLDPFSGNSTLDLKDPSTPARRAAYTRSNTDQPTSNNHEETRPPPKKATTAPSSFVPPTVRLSHSDDQDAPPPSPTASPIIPPRTSSLYTGTRSPTSGSGSPRASSRRTHSPLKPRNGNLHGQTPQTPLRNNLRVHHRATASSSEPSLVPIADDPRNRDRGDPMKTVTLRRSSYFGGTTTGGSDLGVNDLALSRFASNSPSKDDGGDLEGRGQELAAKCWAEDEEFLAKEKIAEWLGGTGRINKLALRHYMNFFDFATLRLDMAFRRLCAKLYLKAETQQVDRILEEFSRRYWDCNPATVYGSASVVHAVSYSLLLLNTDLHIAELSTHMSRNQFVRNTLSTIQMQLQSPSQLSTSDLTYDDSGSSLRGSDAETISRTKRSDSITSWNSVSKEAAMAPSPAMPGSAVQFTSPGQHSNGSTPSVQVSLHSSQQRTPDMGSVYGRTWETDMENLLRDMYNSVKSQQILQPISGRPSMSSLSPGPAMLRNRSLRGQPDRLATLKRGSIRGLQSILNAQAGVSPYSSNSSIDGRASPSPSFATSANETGTSSFLTPTLGFASNLSHTIIRETREDDDHSLDSHESGSTSISITDEELALLGPPWAKEGRLCRKQYWESTGKRAKDKNWLDVFVVIQKGELNMFTFGEHGGGGGGVVGGGNWLTNANSVGTVHLAHSLAHALPPPGYNKQRPHCMVLTLSNGGVYFFQAGTEELVNEWVSTCNYWAARTSKEPLAGGVSNMEYGWNRVAEPLTHGRSVSDNESTKDYSDAMSVRSGRSTRSRFGWREGVATVRAANSPWVDRIFINDWKPPMPPTVSSMHDEETQLEALTKHVASMKADLQKHNELREPMAALYQPRSANAMKAQSNWEKKSQYLLTEIVKYDSYIDSLQIAMSLRLKKRGEKVLEKALNGATPDDGKWKGPDEETIEEAEEPLTPSNPNAHFHRRETAESGPNGNP